MDCDRMPFNVFPYLGFSIDAEYLLHEASTHTHSHANWVIQGHIDRSVLDITYNNTRNT